MTTSSFGLFLTITSPVSLSIGLSICLKTPELLIKYHLNKVQLEEKKSPKGLNLATCSGAGEVGDVSRTV